MPSKTNGGDRVSEEVKLIPFPKCTECCRLIEELGASECENQCPDKFKKILTTTKEIV